MNKGLFSKILPHLIAIIVFLVVSLFFAKPVIEGNELNQGDIDGWRGMAQNAFDYKEQHGHYPLWNPNAFSGMPNFMIVMEGKSFLYKITDILTLGLPQPINQFFLACLCFYILCLSLGARPVTAIFGALAYGFATYNPIIIAAGHVTKMFAIAYLPLLLAGIINTYEKRYWLGLALTTLGTYLQIQANHPQISYYAVIIAAAISVAYLVTWIRNKEWKHFGMAVAITVIAALIGVMGNALSILVIPEYSKASIRGGKSVEIKGDSVYAVKNTGGLDTSYAFSYSLGKGEALTTLMPNAFGGNGRARLSEESAVTDILVKNNIPEAQASQFSASLPKFWGNQDSTAGGPLYAGAIVCILALIGFVLYKKPLRWALLAVAVLAIMMAWGRHLLGFNLFLFENVPLYDKFRAPSINMVMVQFILPLMAVLSLQWIFYRDNSRELLKKDFKKILFTLGGLTVFLLLAYLMMDYKAEFDAQIISQYQENGLGNLIVRGLKEERRSMFGGQVIRTIVFAILVLAAFWLYMKNMLKPVVAIAILACITVIDLMVVDKDYLNEDSYRTKDTSEHKILPTSIDQQLLADKSHFRVFSQSPERFSQADYHYSAFHRAVGGYHPAKIRIYNDVITRYLFGYDNPEILNMLNTKYVITTDQQGKQSVLINDRAYGPAWFVKTIKPMRDEVEYLQSLGVTNLKDTALLEQSLAGKVSPFQWDSAASITLTKFDNDAIEYSTNAASPQFAIFSEVYYPYGWNAYIDGTKAEYVRADYTLRGMAVPAGKHTIRFVFEPSAYKTGNTLSYIACFLILIITIGGLYMAWRVHNKQ